MVLCRRNGRNQRKYLIPQKMLQRLGVWEFACGGNEAVDGAVEAGISVNRLGSLVIDLFNIGRHRQLNC